MTALRAYARYIVPMTLLGVLACAPLLLFAWKARPPADVAAARMQVRIAWVLAGSALAWKLLLVAGVAPAVRSVAAREPLSQLAAFTAGLRGLARGLLPWAVAVIAVLLGGVALVVPGVLLVLLVSLTGASRLLGTSAQAAIADSIAVVRPQLGRVALILAAIIAVDLVITLGLQLQLVPMLTKKLAAKSLVPVRTFFRAALVGAAALAPLAACVLAARYSDAERR